MSDRPTVRPATLLGLALGGVLLGHAVTYRLLLLDAHARATELARTGHGYLTGANTLGFLAVVAAMAAVFLGRLLRGETPTASVVAWRLATFQVASFAALEVLERLGSGIRLRPDGAAAPHRCSRPAPGRGSRRAAGSVRRPHRGRRRRPRRSRHRRVAAPAAGRRATRDGPVVPDSRGEPLSFHPVGLRPPSVPADTVVPTRDPRTNRNEQEEHHASSHHRVDRRGHPRAAADIPRARPRRSHTGRSRHRHRLRRRTRLCRTAQRRPADHRTRRRARHRPRARRAERGRHVRRPNDDPHAGARLRGRRVGHPRRLPRGLHPERGRARTRST